MKRTLLASKQIRFCDLKESLKLILKESVDTAKAQEIKYEVREAVRSYLLTRTIAEEITTAELTQRVMNVHSDISSFICEDMKITGVRVSFINQTCGWNERFRTEWQKCKFCHYCFCRKEGFWSRGCAFRHALSGAAGKSEL